MNERLREGNFLMKDLQQRMALSPGPSAGAQPPRQADGTTESEGEEVKPMNRAFRWLFGG